MFKRFYIMADPHHMRGPLDNLPTEADLNRPSDRRKYPRFNSPPIACGQGIVVDISASGMRLRIAGKTKIDEGATIEVTLKGDPDDLKVVTKVAWVKRSGFRSREIGLEFVGVDEKLRHALTVMARNMVVGTPSAEWVSKAA